MDRWLRLFAPEAKTHDPAGAPPRTGMRRFGYSCRESTTPFASVSLTKQQRFSNASSAAVHWSGQAVARSGKSIDVADIDVIRCNESGSIVLVLAFWNPGQVMAILSDSRRLTQLRL